MICSACDIDICELCGQHCHCSHHRQVPNRPAPQRTAHR